MKGNRTLVIVESPTKAKALSSFLPKNYVVMASKGHISHIADGGRYWNTGIDPKNGFEADYEVDADKADTVKKLAEQARLADKVVICSDPDSICDPKCAKLVDDWHIYRNKTTLNICRIYG